jgi:hypothetical protein
MTTSSLLKHIAITLILAAAQLSISTAQAAVKVGSYVGTWKASAIYVAGDLITFSDKTFLSLAKNKSKNPNSNPKVWQVLGGVGADGLGVIGPQGLQGIQGVAGPIGATGIQGPIGLTGAIGPKGDTGLQGLTGSAGTNGTNGAVGPKGDTGAQGPIGLTGPAGANGTAGAQGIQGIQGIKGDTGLTGVSGAGAGVLKVFDANHNVIGDFHGSAYGTEVFIDINGKTYGLFVESDGFPDPQITYKSYISNDCTGTAYYQIPFTNHFGLNNFLWIANKIYEFDPTKATGIIAHSNFYNISGIGCVIVFSPRTIQAELFEDLILIQDLSIYPTPFTIGK